MLSPNRRSPRLRWSDSVIPRALVLALSMALGACSGTDNPLAPGSADEAPVPASDSGAPDFVVTALTGQRIAFASYRNGNQDIYRMDPQGYQVNRLTYASANEVSPDWSRDNKRIAFVRPRVDASNVTHYDVYIINADGTNGHWARSTPSPYNLGNPQWSPDGSHILLTVTVQGVWYAGWLQLATGKIGFFYNGFAAVKGKQPSYDPTGQKVVYIGSDSKSLNMINNGTHVTLLTAPGSTLDRPVFSPDGKRIAFSNAAGNGDQEIYVRNADASITRLTYTKGTDLWPSWSSDGSKIAFASTRNGPLQIWIMSATGASPTRISRNTYAELTPAFSH